MPRAWLFGTVLFASGTGAGTAEAHPRPLPFSYTVASQPQGALEVEQYVDLTPLQVTRETDVGTEEVTALRAILQTELEYGFTDRLEGAFYFVFRQGASSQTPALRFQGLKQRLRYRLFDDVEAPVGLSLYGEVAEYFDEFEFEEKVILSKRLGPWLLAANATFEQEYYFQDEGTKFIYQPSAGVAYEVVPAFSLGLEYWTRGSMGGEGPPTVIDGTEASSPHYAGVTTLLQATGAWISLGAYLRADGLGEAVPVGDSWGRVWVRTIVGIDL